MKRTLWMLAYNGLVAATLFTATDTHSQGSAFDLQEFFTRAVADRAVTAASVPTLSNQLVLTITNPAPASSSWFGLAVATVGTDRLLIGTYHGGAYLFSTNGALLTTFTNPAGHYFGSSVAAVGTDRVLIGAYGDDGGTTNVSTAYLFSTDGVLLTTFTNPGRTNDGFGHSVAALGTDRVVIGTYNGGAYLFSIETAPTLTVTLTATNTSILSWPFPSIGFDLEQNSTIETTNWTSVTNRVQNDNAFKWVVIPANTGSKFYRLRK